MQTRITWALPDKYKSAEEKDRDAALRKRWCQGVFAAITERCRRRGITLAMLRGKAGLRQDQLRKIGEGHVPSALTLACIAAALETTVDDLIGDPPLQPGLAEAVSPPFIHPATSHQPTMGRLPQAALAVVAPAPYGARLGGAGRLRNTLLPPFEIQAELLRYRLNGTAADFLWADVDGTEMLPELIDGDRVLIDQRQRRAPFSGLYAIESGGALVARSIEPVPETQPRRYRVRCSDPRFPTYEIAEEELRTLGRVVWISRCL